MYNYFLHHRLFNDFKFYRLMQIPRFLELRSFYSYPKDSPEFLLFFNFAKTWFTHMNIHKPLPLFFKNKIAFPSSLPSSSPPHPQEGGATLRHSPKEKGGGPPIPDFLFPSPPIKDGGGGFAPHLRWGQIPIPAFGGEGGEGVAPPSVGGGGSPAKDNDIVHGVLPPLPGGGALCISTTFFLWGPFLLYLQLFITDLVK